MYVINDAGRHGNESMILSAFTDKENQVNVYFYSYEYLDQQPF